MILMMFYVQMGLYLQTLVSGKETQTPWQGRLKL